MYTIPTYEVPVYCPECNTYGKLGHACRHCEKLLGVQITTTADSQDATVWIDPRSVPQLPTGWQCPQCRRIYSPFVCECACCNSASVSKLDYNHVESLTNGSS